MPEEETQEKLVEWILNELPNSGHLTLDCIVQAWIDHATKETREKLDEFILNGLPHPGYLTLEYTVHWNDSTATKVRETLWRLKEEGRVKPLKDGTRWKLRNRPVIVMEMPGDPNFRRGGK